MCNSAVPMLVLIAGPLVFLAVRLNGMRSPAIRWSLGALILGILIVKSPEAGFDTAQLDRVKLLLAASAAIFLFAESALSTEVRRFWLLVIALASVLAHLNFLAFHGRGSFAHVHDAAHYYLGSKYAPEISYGELYAAVARAELELHDGRLPVGHARDLTTGAVVPIEGVLARGESVERRFGEERWQAFRHDVEAVHELMGSRFPEFLNDHGYNPTPVWSLVGGSVANLVPAGSRTGIRALTLADPVLLLLAFSSIFWAFGFETGCLAAAYYAVLYGAIFDWVGGAFLRNLWFTATILGASLLHRSRPIVAGACLGMATTLRVFPIFFLFGPTIAAARAFGRRLPNRGADARLLGGFAVAAASLIVSSFAFTGGPGRWLEFQRNLNAHTEALTSNFVGLPTWLRYAVLGIGLGGEASVEQIFAPAGATYRVLVGLLLVGSSFAAARLSLRTDDSSTRLAVGLFPIVFGLQLAHYYYVALVLLVLAHRSRPERLAMLFAAEAALYVLAFFEIHFSVMCLFRGLVTAYLLIALWFDDLRVEARTVLGAR